MRLLIFCLVRSALFAQSAEKGEIVRQGDQSVLMVGSPRPLDAAATTLAEQFHIVMNVEDPQYIYKDDVKDVTAEVSRVPNPSRRVIVPRGGRLELRFSVRSDGLPQDVPRLLQDLVTVANANFPFAYRLDDDMGVLTLVPAQTRDEQGRIIHTTPLLDRKVTIPAGTRSLIDHAKLLTNALEAFTGGRVSCCQGSIAGIPWGMQQVNFEAHDEPARHVLARLFEIEPGKGRYYWLLRCDPGLGWCFINYRGVR